MSRKQKFERLFELPDDETYAEYLKLSPEEKREYEKLARARAEHYKHLTMETNAKIKELEEQLKQKDEEYRRLKSLH